MQVLEALLPTLNFPYTSTYSFTPQNINRKHNIHHIPCADIQHISTLQGPKTLFLTTAATQHTFPQTPTQSEWADNNNNRRSTKWWCWKTLEAASATGKYYRNYDAEVKSLENRGQAVIYLTDNNSEYVVFLTDSQSWTCTDGSATYAVQDGGAGSLIYLPNGQTLESASATGKYCTNYDAEVKVLEQGVQAGIDLMDTNSEDVVFLTDSRSVLDSLAGHGEHNLGRKLYIILEHRRVILQWMPAHCGIKGNEHVQSKEDTR